MRDVAARIGSKTAVDPNLILEILVALLQIVSERCKQTPETVKDWVEAKDVNFILRPIAQARREKKLYRIVHNHMKTDKKKYKEVAYQIEREVHAATLDDMRRAYAYAGIAT